MGYTSGELNIPLILDNHLGEQHWRDREAADQLKHEIQMLIESNPAYERIACIGVSGGY